MDQYVPSKDAVEHRVVEDAPPHVLDMGAVTHVMDVPAIAQEPVTVGAITMDVKVVVTVHVTADLVTVILVDAHVLAIVEMIALVNPIGDQLQHPQLTHRSRPAAPAVLRIVRAVAEGVVVGAVLGAAIRVIGPVILDVKKLVTPDVTLDVLMGA